MGRGSASWISFSWGHLPFVFGILLFTGLLQADPSAPFIPNDPLFFTNSLPQNPAGEWHLAKQDSGANIDINVLPAWSDGWTGEGVTIGILEFAAFDYTHPDLAPNYDAADSFSWVSGGAGIASHPTGTAGLAAGRGGNGIGITGAAPFAHVASLSIDNTIYAADNDYLTALMYHNDAIKIKSMSVGDLYPWGASEFNYNGQPAASLRAAEQSAANSGEILVRAAGNYRTNSPSWFGNSNVFLDKNSPNMIVVSAVNSTGKFCSYSNYGANITVAAPSGDDVGGAIPFLATDYPGGLYGSFDGTSASTPLVSGALAMAAQAQPNLDMRFAKHLLAMTSQVVDPNDSSSTGGWHTNAAGYHFNNNYGFGLVDASALVRAAQRYSGVTPQTIMNTGPVSINHSVPEDDRNGLTATFTLPAGQPLEEVTATISFNTSTPWWQDSVELISPSGTMSILQYSTSEGYDGANFYGMPSWDYVSNAFWGESPAGQWTLIFRDDPSTDPDETNAQVYVDAAELTVRGGSLIPVPEPSSLLLLGFSGAGLCLRRRNKK